LEKEDKTLVKQALIVIDIQNDYFPEGKYPLHKPELAMQETLKAMAIATEKSIPIIHIRHLVPVEAGEGLFCIDRNRIRLAPTCFAHHVVRLLDER